MKKIAIMALSVLAGITSVFAAKEVKSPVSRVDPPYWWIGMANDTLQLMVNGPDIANAEFKVDYPGVSLVNQVSLDSKNYKFIDLVINPDARPGKINLGYTLNGKKYNMPYELKARDRAASDYKGFDAGDVLYLVMPDRFAKGLKDSEIDVSGLEYKVMPDREKPNSRHGGDMRGIRNNLDYIDSLGVTAIWVCPVLENDMPGGSYHGYATTDYYRIDPRFGSNEEWNALISDAHERGLKVVMDMIFNHSGSNHPWMKDVPSADWFNHPEAIENPTYEEMTNYRLTTVHDPYVSDYDLDKTVNGWFVPSMPDLNQKNPYLMKYLTQNSIWWIENSKIDGIRMDTYPYADMNAMSKWAADVLKEYPGFNIVGECWYGNEAGSSFWQTGSPLNPVDTNLPTVMDFWFVQNGKKAFNSETTPWEGLNNVYDHLANDFLFPNPQKILTFVDNHDTDRFLAEMPEDLGSWKQAMAFLLTSRGIPQLYYGTELLMNGSKEKSDGFVRLDMPGGFPGDTVNAFVAEGRTDIQNEAWNYLSKILNWRRGEANEVIAKGSLKHFMPQTGLYVYERKLGDKKVVVMMNGKDTDITVPMNRTLEIMPYGTKMKNILNGQDVTISEQMTFAPREVLILQNW